MKGAPVKWKAIRPTFGRPNAIGVAKRAPHPHAGLLFADFMLSKEGQTILKERNRVPASLSVDTHLNKFPFQMIDPVITLDEDAKWEKLWSDLFLKGRKIEKESNETHDAPGSSPPPWWRPLRPSRHAQVKAAPPSHRLSPTTRSRPAAEAHGRRKNKSRSTSTTSARRRHGCAVQASRRIRHQGERLRAKREGACTRGHRGARQSPHRRRGETNVPSSKALSRARNPVSA